jgi:hypothetical protein
VSEKIRMDQKCETLLVVADAMNLKVAAGFSSKVHLQHVTIAITESTGLMSRLKEWSKPRPMHSHNIPNTHEKPNIPSPESHDDHL